VPNRNKSGKVGAANNGNAATPSAQIVPNKIGSGAFSDPFRTVGDGGQSYYFCGDHRQTIPTLWQQLVSAGA
jgi:hypothetical protein